MTQRKGIALLLGALLVVAGACGGDESDESDGSADRQADPTDQAAGDAGADDPASDAGDQGDASGGPVDIGGLDGFCRTVVDARNEVTDLQESLSVDFTAAPQAYASAYQTLSDIEPPDEIAEDWDTVTGLVGDIADTLATIDASDPAAIADAFDTPEMQARSAAAEEASNRIDDYVTEQCGVNLDDPDAG